MTADGGSTGPAPVATVSLVTHNGRGWLPGCLAGLAAQELDDYELVIHDNASTDDSIELLRVHAKDPRTRLIESQRNIGYAAANDRIIAQARGRFVLLLNQDVELDPGFLSAAVGAFESHPEVAAVQGRVRQLGTNGQRRETLDTTGLGLGRDRRAISRSRGQPDGAAHSVGGPVWGADGPAPVYRRSALLDSRLPSANGGWEVLDRDFFMQKEDVDLAWRLRLLGWEAWYEPAALAWHARGTGDSGASGLLGIARANRAISAHARSLSWRNQRLMQLKNERLNELLRDLPWIATREVLTLAYLAIVDPRALMAARDLVEALPAARRKRRYLQARVRQQAGRRSYPFEEGPRV